MHGTPLSITRAKKYVTYLHDRDIPGLQHWYPSDTEERWSFRHPICLVILPCLCQVMLFDRQCIMKHWSLQRYSLKALASRISGMANFMRTKRLTANLSAGTNPPRHFQCPTTFHLLKGGNMTLKNTTIPRTLFKHPRFGGAAAKTRELLV